MLGTLVRAALAPGAGAGTGDGAAAVGEAVTGALAAAAPRGLAPPPGGALLPCASARCGMSTVLTAAVAAGRVALDGVQLEYVQTLLKPPPAATTTTTSTTPSDPPDIDARVAEVADVLPGYGRGFVIAALRALDFSPERVVATLLDGDLPPALAALDAALATPPPLPAAVAVATAAPTAQPKNEERSFARPVPRSLARFLGGASDADRAATVARALDAQWDSDDEPDDGDSDGGGVAAAAAGDDDVEAGPSSRAWVAGGKVYAYKRAGAREVRGGGAAVADAVAADRAAAEAARFHGLGRGGNRVQEVARGGGRGGLPVDRGDDASDGGDDNGPHPPGFGPDRGRGGRLQGRGRGGRSRGGGGRGHFQRERAQRKAGGGMG